MKEQHNALFDAAAILVQFRVTGYRDVAMDLYEALDALVEAMIGKEDSDWKYSDLDAIEVAAKCVCAVFGVGFTLDMNRMLEWDV